MPSQRARLGYPRRQAVLTEEGADLEGVVLSKADLSLVQVYGDQVRQNDGCHMDGGIKDSDVRQMRWRLLVIQPGSRYRAPQGAVGRRFVKYLTEELRGARYRRWNMERPMVFMGVILQTTPGGCMAHKIHRRITRLLDLWEIRKCAALCFGHSSREPILASEDDAGK